MRKRISVAIVAAAMTAAVGVSLAFAGGDRTKASPYKVGFVFIDPLGDYGWTYRHNPDGSYTWTTATGHHYTGPATRPWSDSDADPPPA